jgi:phospholipid/cholesterol/gamma-HCH transport system ATP-binding protein
MLEVRRFCKRYAGREVLTGVDLDVARGETVALIGKSGCGKSTLLRHIARLEDAGTGPISGEIRLEGFDVLRAGERALARRRFRGKKVGMVFQHAALFDFLTVEGNLVWPLREIDRLGADEARARARECLVLVELPAEDAFLAREVTGLSGGERKRLALARTLALRPELVLYDEPTTGLDPPTVTEVNALLNRLKKKAGITAILTSHDMRATLEVADRIAMIRAGRVVFSGAAASALEDEEVKRFMEGREGNGHG